jgi:hypothetical protein
LKDAARREHYPGDLGPSAASGPNSSSETFEAARRSKHDALNDAAWIL